MTTKRDEATMSEVRKLVERWHDKAKRDFEADQEDAADIWDVCATELKAALNETEGARPDSITLNMDLQTAGEIGLFEFLNSKGFEVKSNDK